MKHNLWMYANNEITNKVAGGLVVFGSHHFFDAKIIKNLELLEESSIKVQNRLAEPDKVMVDIVYSHLIDCIKILIFFENYMKAELMLAGYCVHQLKKEVPGFKEIAGKQFKEPILIEEILSIWQGNFRFY